MKQILQQLRFGTTLLEEVLCSRAPSGQILIRTSATLVSAGTERMLVAFGKANLDRFTIDQLMIILNRLHQDVDIKISVYPRTRASASHQVKANSGNDFAKRQTP